MMADKAAQRNRRQDPVSCRLCRLKKLKCSRQQPCSNCVARNAECEFEPNHSTTTARIQQDVQPSNADILSRLQRLEDMIVRMNQHGPQTPDSFTPRKDNDVNAPAWTPIEASQQYESQHLSNLGEHQPSMYTVMSASWVFEMVPLEDIIKHTSTTHEPSITSHQSRKILIPCYADARDLFDNYVKYIRHYHHIVHIPTLREKIFETFYQKISKQEPVDTDHAALLLAVFASVVYYLLKSEDEGEYTAATDRKHTFLVLFRYALDLIDHSRRVLPGSLEIIQTAIILVFLDYNLEGFTLRTRAILSQAIQTAKELSMHRLDSPAAVSRRDSSMTIDAMIDLEMRRRVWWHLVSTEWMTSLAGNTQEGTYTAHPSQMRVVFPRNVDDDVLDRGNITEDSPWTSPTAMSYPLQRIRLGQLSRDAVDALEFGIAAPSEIDYETVMLLDKRIENFIADIPLFLRLDAESIRKSHHVLERYPYFAMQRYIINIGAQTMRCKVHQPFLLRSGAREKYSQSVEICLTSAIKVIEINKAIRHDPTHHIPARVKLSGLLHHMFLATVVLVVDLCFNRAPEGTDQKGAEVLQAIKFMEEARGESVTVQKFLDTLTEVLRRHHVRLKEVMPNEISSKDHSNQKQGQAPHNQFNQTMTPAAINTLQPFGFGYDDMWRDALFQADSLSMPAMPQMPDWDQLFSELDTFIA